MMMVMPGFSVADGLGHRRVKFPFAETIMADTGCQILSDFQKCFFFGLPLKPALERGYAAAT